MYIVYIWMYRGLKHTFHYTPTCGLLLHNIRIEHARYDMEILTDTDHHLMFIHFETKKVVTKAIVYDKRNARE